MAFLRKLTQSLTISVGLFVAALALVVVFWPEANLDRWHRLALFPLLPLACCAWGILCVAIARKAGWRAQRGAGLAVVTFFVAYILATVISPKPPVWGGLCLLLGLFCRKLYSESEWNRTAVESSALLTTLKLNS
jgi:cytochrome bd-type quinol oxidase subunit 2